MEVAQIKGSVPAIHIAAQELRGWDPRAVRATEFSCVGCTAPVHPKAYELNRLVQAHFSLYQHRPGHDAGCTAVGLPPQEPGHDAGHDTLLAAPPRWPTRLVEVEPSAGGLLRLVDTAIVGRSEGSGRTRPCTGVEPAAHRPGREPPTPARAASIHVFAHGFMQMTAEQRHHAPIELPGVHADRYAFAFKRLPQWRIEPLKHPRRVFYGLLRWTSELNDTGTEYRIALHAGQWDAPAKGFSRMWELRVDHSGWAQRDRSVFLDELHSALNQARDENKQPWFFALATQSKLDPAVIATHTRRRVAFVARAT